MTLRAILATLFALAVLFAPLGAQSGNAMAMAPAEHQMQMGSDGHCGEQSSGKQEGKKLGMACCAAMCTAVAVAVAVAPSVVGEPLPFERSPEQPAAQQYRHSFLIELATPPPRLA